MFFKSRKKKQDIFEQRAKQQNVWRHVRRVIDKCAPNLMVGQETNRVSERYTRCVPMLCAPIVDDAIDVENTIFAVTFDISANGIGILSTVEPNCDIPAICGFNFDEPVLLVGSLYRCRSFGGQFFKTGINITDVVEDSLLVEELSEKLGQLKPREEAVCMASGVQA